MQTHPEAARTATTAPREGPLSLELRREPRGPVLAAEDVEPGDLTDALAELWFDADLRRGFAEVGLHQVRAQLRPVYREHAETGRYCAGFELECAAPSGPPTVRFFARDCLAHVAARRARHLVAEGLLRRDDLYWYTLAPGTGATALRGPEGCGTLDPLRVPLRRLRELVSETCDVAGQHYPVFYTRAALERAERISRKGAEAQPPVETGGLLVGPLCACPETGEAFSVVADVLEATHSEATTYSLRYSGDTWARIQAILRARQAQPATRHHRVLGQCHGHNFLPLAGAEPCEVCHLVPVCTRTSAVLSPEDRLWCRAVFHGQPWQLSHVFGLDARARSVDAFYGQRGAALVQRGYHVVDARVGELLGTGA